MPSRRDFEQWQKTIAKLPTPQIQDGVGLELMRDLESYVLYEDDADLLILDKPAGIASHFSNRFPFGVEEIVRFTRGMNILLVSSLDIDTSGIIVFAKNEQAFQEMSYLFSQKKDADLMKLYLAALWGEFPSRAPITVEVGIEPERDERRMRTMELATLAPQDPRYSLTVFHPLSLYRRTAGDKEPVSVAAIRNVTGNTHQIRVVAAQELAMPVIGDILYGQAIGARRQLLHSSGISFNHFRTGERITINCDLPKDFRVYLSELQKIKDYIVTKSL